MLKGLEKEGGTSVEKSSTVLGAVLQYSEKRSGLLDDISNLTSFHHSSDDDNMSVEMLLGCKYLVYAARDGGSTGFSEQFFSDKVEGL